MKKAFLTLATLVLLGTAFAQTKFPLVIVCSEMGADVYINDKLYTKTVPNLEIQLPPAVYSIKIAKVGFREFNQDVTVLAQSQGTILNAMLQPFRAPAQLGAPSTLLPMFPLNVTSNVPGAQVYINGNPVGQAPYGQNVVGGTYEIRVTAPGYSDFQQRMNVRSPTQVNAMLQGFSSQLSVSSNVDGAEVVINGNSAGRVPFVAQLPMGSYMVLVRAPGYLDFQQSVVVGNGGVQVNAFLQGASASWQFRVPEGFAYEKGKGQRQGARLWIDGVPQNDFAGQMMPGRHVVRFALGDLSAEAQVDAQSGRTYVFEPFIGINVR
jgi:hypothetical protein